MFKSKVTFSLLIALLLVCVAQPARAQTAGPTESTASSNQTELQLLRVLISEVRQLRFAMQESTIRQHRSTLIFERIRRQQDIIDMIESHRDDLSDQIGELTNSERYDEEIDELKAYEGEITETTDPQERADLVQEQSRIKRALERKKKADGNQVERLRDRARQVQTKLENERATLTDLQYQLDILEREMERQIGIAGKQQAAKDQSSQH
jgi:TolA-binding protein